MGGVKGALRRSARPRRSAATVIVSLGGIQKVNKQERLHIGGQQVTFLHNVNWISYHILLNKLFPNIWELLVYGTE